MTTLPQLNLPSPRLNIRADGDYYQVMDVLRRRFVKLTPEEWVRQHFIHYLIECKNYPMGLLGNEISLKLLGTKRRCDSVLFGNDCQPRMIMEYKAPHIALTQKVLDQACNYNLVLRTPWLILSNGLQHACCHINLATGAFDFKTEIPSYEDLDND